MTSKDYQTQEQSTKCRAEVNAKFNETKLNIKEMTNEVKQIGEEQIRQGVELKYMRVSMNSLDAKMSDFIKSSDRRYASKLSEKIVYSMAGLILLSFTGAIITLVINK